MDAILEKILELFSRADISISKKIMFPLIALLSLYLINDYYGYTYYIFNSRKIDYIAKVQGVRNEFKSDSLVVTYMDEALYEAMHRKNVFQQFTTLFEDEAPVEYKITDYENICQAEPEIKDEEDLLICDQEEATTFTVRNDSIMISTVPLPGTRQEDEDDSVIATAPIEGSTNIEKSEPITEGSEPTYQEEVMVEQAPAESRPARNKALHILTSSFVFIIPSICLIVFIFYCPFMPKMKEKGIDEILKVESKVIISLVFCLIGIWALESFFSLIPVVKSGVWINYSIQAVVNIILAAIFIVFFTNDKKKNS